MKTFPENMPDWAYYMNCAVTVCNADCEIIYQNDKAKQTYRKHGNLIGKNLMDCHKDHARAIIRQLLETGGSNAYTIEKEGLHKMIYQIAYSLEDGTVGGLVEISMVIPAEMPHYIRK